MARIGGGLLLITVLAFGVTLLAKRYLPGIRGFSADGKSHVQLLESRRITARLTLFVIEFEGRRLLLAQSGDRVVEVGARPAARGENTVVDQ
jgi:flagellar biogenesis protein FliO